MATCYVYENSSASQQQSNVENSGVKVIGVYGVDIVHGKFNLTLGVVWQICKMYWQERVGKLNDEQLIAWGNSQVPSELHIKSLKDPSISNCKFLLNIIESIKKGTCKRINPRYVGESCLPNSDTFRRTSTNDNLQPN